jgi:hypothetical protein
MLFSLSEVSGNRKTGKISVAKASSDTCPPSCGVFFACYGKAHWCKNHWDRLDAGHGLTFDKFLVEIKKKVDGLWRYGEVGGLPGKGNVVDRQKLQALTSANKGKRGFTYSAEPMFAGNYRVTGNPGECKKGKVSESLAANNRAAVKEANENEHADRNYNLGIAPVVTILPSDAAKGTRYITPEGRKIITCPAAVDSLKDKEITCKTCQLCAFPNRKSIIGFPAHGVSKGKINKHLNIVK